LIVLTFTLTQPFRKVFLTASAEKVSVEILH